VTTTTRAVVFEEPGVVRVRQVEIPEPGPGDVVVRTVSSWISPGTEASYLRGERLAGDTPRGPDDPMPFPVVAGYQKIGVVEHVGPEVDAVSVGQTVFCSVGRAEGMWEKWAGHLEHSVAPASEVWALPGDVDPLAFAPLVLAQVGWNCGQRPGRDAGLDAVVLGDGLVGQWAAQTLLDRGFDVVLAGRHRDRLELFEKLGGRVLNLAEEPLAAGLDRLCADGLSVVVDAVGHIPTLLDAAGRVRLFGHVVSAGFYGTDDRLPLQQLRAAELTVHLVAGWTRPRMDRTLELIAEGRLQTLPLLTHRFPVEQAAEAWRVIEDRAEPSLGVVLDWADRPGGGS
jgi:3-hydroxyethyl bacteriochlorophyllide a dehydrogenase